MPEPGEIFAQRYRLERLLARGGMGSVWIAHDERLSRAVAIKFMDPELAASEELRQRFEREARAAGALKTRHVVQVHDFGVIDEVGYIVMELLEGEDLGARLSRVRRMGLRDTAAIGVQIARGLRHAHEAGIVHRDLKPQNLFITREDDGEVVKILDFGVAKRTALGGALGDATTTKQLLGSPTFMSPEQTRARGVDHRSDVWALGVILYRMLTGQLPFSSEHLVDLMVRIQFDPHPPPSSLDPALAPLDPLFDKALAKDPDQRFQSAIELATALSEHLAAAGGSPPILEPTPVPLHSGAFPMPSLGAVPMPLSGSGAGLGNTPAPTPAPRSGATPMGPSMYGVSPPSVMPSGLPRFRPAALLAAAILITALVTIVAIVALSGGDGDGPPAAAARPRVASTPATPAETDQVAAPSAAATEVAPPPAVSAATEPPASAAPRASSSPAVRASSAAKAPAPKGSGEKKLLLTY